VAARQWTDWWIRGVLPLWVGQLALFAALHARPGSLGVVLWRWGPSLLILSAAGLLAAALVSAAKGKLMFSARRGAALAGLFILVYSTIMLYRTYPSSYDDRPSRVDFRLPLDGPVTVAWGGPTRDVNYHVKSPGERWGYDLLVAVNGRTYRTDGLSLADYYAYGLPARSPASGHVVHAIDGIPDAPPRNADRQGGAGNHVVLEVAPRQYLFIAHLRPGTVRVRAGDAVRQGDVLGEVGSSGNSSEPHVHLHLQDTPLPLSGEGIPFHFADARLAGADPAAARPMPEGGMQGRRYVGDVVVSAAAN